MSFAAVGVGGAIAAGVGAAGGIAGGIIQGNAARGAADTQAQAAEQATALQKQEFDQQQQNQQPYLQAGTQALSQLQDPSFQKSFSMSDFQADPGYAFRMQQGQQALERSAAARGGLQTGGTLKALNDYAQNSASNEYQNAYSRFTNDQNNRFGRLSTIAGMGQGATGQMAQAGQNYATQAGSNMTGAANAQAAGQIAGGNSLGTTLSSLGTGLGKTWMDYSAMNKMPNWAQMLPPPPSGGGGGGSPYSLGVDYHF